MPETPQDTLEKARQVLRAEMAILARQIAACKKLRSAYAAALRKLGEKPAKKPPSSSRSGR